MRGRFVERISRYASYHRDGRNKALHFFGVPAIAVSLLLPPALVEFGAAGGYDLSLATAFAAAVCLYWIALDRPFGVAASLAFLPALPFADWLAAQGETAVGTAFALLFAGGWALQLLGHAFEGRKPALLDNVLQVFIAPIFLVAEAAFALGLRKDLAAEVESRWRTYLPQAGEGDAARAA